MVVLIYEWMYDENGYYIWRKQEMQMTIYFENYLFTFLLDSCLRIALQIYDFFFSAIGNDDALLGWRLIYLISSCTVI